MQKILIIETGIVNQIVNITDDIESFINSKSIINGLINIYAQQETCAILIQENMNDNGDIDMLELIHQVISKEKFDNSIKKTKINAQLKAGIIGQSKTIPIIDRKIVISEEQSVFFCDFEKLKNKRKIILTLIRT